MIPGYKAYVKTLIHILFLIVVTMPCLQAQSSDIPVYKPEKKTIRIPLFLPGVLKDSTAIELNDTLIYEVKGQFFDPTLPVRPGRRFTAPASPWQTIFEMADAYAKKDANRIRILYNTASRAKIDAVLNGTQSSAFLDYVSKATRSDLRLIGGMDYRQGILAFSSDSAFGPHLNYLVKEGGVYKLSALDDATGTSWNLGLYFKFRPGPIIRISNLTIPDSLIISDSIRLDLRVSNPESWIAVTPDQIGGMVPCLVQDNGMNDRDPRKGYVSFLLRGSHFIVPGDYRFNINNFNHPVQKIHKVFLDETTGYRIRIKEEALKEGE